MLKSTPLVSIIIPTYNRADLLRQTVDSVLAQTYPHIEIIVINDGSSDHTEEIMRAYGERVRYVKQENQGGSAAANHGYYLSQGEYICFLDHDDLFAPTKIAEQVSAMEADPSVGLCHCAYDLIDIHGERVGFSGVLPDQNFLEELIVSDFLWASAPLIRRNCLEDVGLWDTEIYGADWDLWLRIAIAGYGFHCIQTSLGAYRIYTNSMMSNIDAVNAGHFEIIERTFANPRLPEALRGRKTSVLAQAHFQAACWYYRDGRWEEAQDEYARTIALRGEVSEGDVLAFAHEALSVRCQDPVGFMQGIFGHLPPQARELAQQGIPAIAATRFAHAFLLHAKGSETEAQVEASRVPVDCPTILNHADLVVELFAHICAKRDANTIVEEVERFFAQLPQGATQLSRLRRPILAKIHEVRAYQEYAQGQPQRVVQSVTDAIWYQPNLLRKRGVVSILVRSLLSEGKKRVRQFAAS